MDLVIVTGTIGALLAGLACYVAHPYAKRHHWPFVPRYAYGVGVALLAFAPVVFVALDRPTAVLLLFLLALIFGLEGAATGLAHQDDPDPVEATKDADRILSKLDKELRK